MIEILEVMKVVTLGVFLLTEGVRDFKMRRISMISVVVFAAIGIMMQLPQIKENCISILGGILIGIIFIGLAKLTKEKIGYGDGWVLVVTGIYIGFYGNMSLLALSLFIASVVSIILLLCKKVGRKTELPFVAFMMPGYLFWVMM